MRIADHIYTAQDDIDRLQARILELPNDQHVLLKLDDGREIAGIVAGRPTLLQFFNREGREGSNATVRIEQPALHGAEKAGWIDLFVDRIVDVRHLDRGELESRYLAPGNALHAPTPPTANDRP